MNILLIDIDSKIPNLALMKISSYHKLKGDIVGFNVSDPDIIYVSVIFSENKYKADSVKTFYPNAKIIIGGPGYNPTIKLPEYIEKIEPDNSLYGEQKYSVGRVTSGCIRKCSFCIVHKLEPNGIRYIQHPSKIWKEGTILRLLDDNILAMPEAFDEVIDFCLSHDVTTRFEYLDIRLITKSIANKLRKIKHDRGYITFSFDDIIIEKYVRNGIRIMKEAGFRGREMQFLLYLHNESMIDETKRRWEIIREYNCEPFIMSNKLYRTRKIRRITRRGTRPAIWRNLSSDEIFETNIKKGPF